MSHAIAVVVGGERRVVGVAIGALALLAGAVLLAWEGSAAGRYLHHAGAGGPLALELVAFTAGWLLMIVAMMLPTSLPIVATFAALVRRRARPATLVVALVVGYAVTWTAFGMAAYLADRLVHAAVDGIPWLAEHPQVVAGATLGIAGLWHLSPLKERCLDACRSPLGFVLHRWRGVEPVREAFALGVAHGRFCVGCCWSLMLVMFGLGLGSLAWMLALGVVMAVEKNAPWGRRVGRPLGVALILAGLAVVSG